jgi:hypothetical protein
MKIPFQAAAAAAITLFASQAAHAQGAVQWRVQDGGNGHWYSVRRNASPICWDAASELASAMGGYLATITSSQEHQRITSLTAALQGPATELGPWIGATCSGRPWGDWYWVTGEPFAYQGWLPTAPNPGWNEEYVHLWRWLDGRWNDGYRCGTDAPTTVHGYVIEWSADCNNDGIVDYGQCRDGTLPDFNSNSVPDCCESGVPCVLGQYPVQWRVADGGNGHWYVKSTQLGSWNWHAIKANEAGGHLASVLDIAEQNVVGWLNGVSNTWIGGFQKPGSCEPGCGWAWITGEPWQFENWASYAPDNDAGADRLHLDTAGNRWNDYQLSIDNFPAIYEWSADCNDDGIVDYGQILQGQLADTNADGVPDICQGPTCADADIYRDFNVNGADLGILLSQWGPNTPLTESDLNRDGVVNGADLGLLLSFWGTCPN